MVNRVTQICSTDFEQRVEGAQLKKLVFSTVLEQLDMQRQKKKRTVTLHLTQGLIPNRQET